jgi:hypothetical protein
VSDNLSIAQTLNAAFLIALAGRTKSESNRAKRFLARMVESHEWGSVARFYMDGIDLVCGEIERVCDGDPSFTERLRGVSDWVSNKENLKDPQETAERIWSLFFPEACGILSQKHVRVETLRAKRTVNLTELNTVPITDPARQILFTANVLLTICPPPQSHDQLPFSDHLKERIRKICCESQLYAYDHPIPLGVEPEKNEVFYGLRGLDAAFQFERDRGNMSKDHKPTCVLSVSTTHQGLQDIARGYLEEDLSRSADFKNIDVYVFTEADTRRIIDEILVPAVEHYLQRQDARELLGVLGVDGAYGRHYSFLKAIAPFWSIFIRPEIRATFKIDLDQVFPQKELVQQTGASALEHFKSPLWGARGLDSDGQPLELGMIAGALVDQQDISLSIFTPDVPFPKRALSPDEYIFYSTLPQALSTEAEITTRYGTGKLDGKSTCIQRIHVTGGTTGILVDSLRRYRPFTPSFMGRAEDQAYILSVLLNQDRRLGYIHKDGLIMRHDKGAFAQEAIQAAHVGKLIGDYVRILYFSEYAKALTNDVARLKDMVDPFTGCFISKIPISVVYLRFAFKAASFFTDGKGEQGLQFIQTGAARIMKALEFTHGEKSSNMKKNAGVGICIMTPCQQWKMR